MQHLIISLLATICLVHPCLVRAEEKQDPDGGKSLAPVANKRLFELFKTAAAFRDREKRHDALNKLKAVDSNDLASALASALQKPEHRKNALMVIDVFRSALDRRLAPFIVQTIPALKGEWLHLAVRVGGHFPCKELVAPLLEHAVQSRYSRAFHDIGPHGPSGAPNFSSTFVDAAKILFQITKGQIGLKDYPATKEPPSAKEQAKLVATWRAQWQAHLAEKEEKRNGGQ